MLHPVLPRISRSRALRGCGPTPVTLAVLLLCWNASAQTALAQEASGNTTTLSTVTVTGQAAKDAPTELTDWLNNVVPDRFEKSKMPRPPKSLKFDSVVAKATMKLIVSPCVIEKSCVSRVGMP